MRLIICLLLLLCGCSAPPVRCDKHLQPVNTPAAKAATARKSP